MREHLVLISLVAWFGSHPVVVGAESEGVYALPAPLNRLLPLHAKLGRPQPGDWLDQHKETRQTYREYVASQPIRADRRRHVIYVQPMGTFNGSQRKIVTATTELLQIYFQLPTKVLSDLPLSTIPSNARRTHPTWGDKQILSTYVLNQVLKPRLPRDACVLLGLTTSDLWPGEGWNFVFGQASLRDRVGVWSIHRNGDPSADDAAFRLCLRRTLKTATHETGHMFSMSHCTLYECNMCGSNHRAESDRRTMILCPHCLAKLCYATGADPVRRFRQLIGYCKKHGLKKDLPLYEKSLAAIQTD